MTNYQVKESSFNGPFTITPDFLAHREGMTHDAHHLLSFYIRMSKGGKENCKVTSRVIQSVTGVHKDAIAPSRDLLEEFGYITVISGGPRKTYVLSVNMEKLWDENSIWWTHHNRETCFDDRSFDPQKIADENIASVQKVNEMSEKLAEMTAQMEALIAHNQALTEEINNLKTEKSADNNLIQHPDRLSEESDDLIQYPDRLSDSRKVLNIDKELNIDTSVHSPVGRKPGVASSPQSLFTGRVGFSGRVTSPEGKTADEVERQVELPDLVHRINAMLGTRSKIKVDSESWEKLCVNPFTYTNFGGQPQMLEPPADLWDKNPEWRQWAQNTIDYIAKHGSNTASTRNKLVNMLSSGDRTPEGQKFTWANHMDVLNIKDESIKPAVSDEDASLGIDVPNIPKIEDFANGD